MYLVGLSNERFLVWWLHPSNMHLLLCNPCFLEKFFGASRAVVLCRTSQEALKSGPQVACSLPSNLHITTHPNPGYYTEQRAFQDPSALNKNTISEFDIFVDDLYFQSKTDNLQPLVHCKLSTQHGTGGFLCIFKKRCCCGSLQPGSQRSAYTKHNTFYFLTYARNKHIRYGNLADQQ